MTDFTPNYNFLLPNFDQRFWHDEMRRILKGFDSILAKYVALGNVKGVWANGTSYSIGDVLIDEDVGNLYECAVNHVSANTGTFADERATRTSYWINASVTNRFRGSWTTGTEYRAGDFIVSGNKYAVATQSFTSGATFADDETVGYFETLIDLAAIPASAVPVPNVSTALQYVRQNAAGDGYEVVPVSTITGALSLGALALLNDITAGYVNSGASANGTVLTANGSGGASFQAIATPSVGKVVGTRITTTGASTWTVPAGITQVKVTCVGGGGNGGSANGGGQYRCGGGGGGGTAVAWITGLMPGAQINCTVGGGGGATYFGSVGSPLCHATGGASAASNGDTPGADGGVGTVGHLLIGGQGGGGGTSTGGGAGGSSAFGGGGAGTVISGTQFAHGRHGSNYGGGGGGGAAQTGNTANAGQGAQGVIIIEWIEA